jgi:uncharacterized membrane protein YhaH (DUF805 family)
MSWYLQVLKKYAVFSGRARRREYWFFVLFNVIISIVLAIIDTMLGMQVGTGVGILSLIYSLAVLIPALAVSVRRLHDIDRTGWWLLIAFVPLIGVLVLLIFALIAGTAGDNKYGPDPKAAAA